MSRPHLQQLKSVHVWYDIRCLEFKHIQACKCQGDVQVGPKGTEFARYSIDYHYIRNFIQVQRNWKASRAAEHIPEFAKRIVAEYDTDGAITKRVQMTK
jgi:hypothetical protein